MPIISLTGSAHSTSQTSDHILRQQSTLPSQKNKPYRDCHVVRGKIQAKVIHLLPISSSNQVDDILTKPLHYGFFQK